MRDITEELQQAATGAGSHGNDERRRVLAEVVSALQARVGWEDDSGEDWATLGRDDETWAYVHMCVPLVLHIDDVADRLRHIAEMGVVLISVPSLYDTKLRADRDAVLSAVAIPPNVPLRDFDPDGFTAEDLWFYGA